MRTHAELDDLRQRAVALRREGKSRREIKALLGPMSNSTPNDALAGEPPPAWTRRPNAKDHLRTQARELRARGLDYEEIAASLGVAKSSVSLWVRDLPVPPRLSYEERRKRAAAGAREYWAAERAARAASRNAECAAAATEIGTLTDREILIAGAIAYWCEGCKNKPHRRDDRVVFINSDPGLISFFLKFLQTAGVSREDLVLRVYIHESAEVQAAERFWLEHTGVEPSQLRRPVLKHHNPKTMRKNVGGEYYGCLRIDVKGSRTLYRKIEGWASAAMGTSALTAATLGPVSLS
jgi:transposase